MPIEIRTHSKFSSHVQPTRIKRMAQKTLRAENIKAALTIYITTDAEIRSLNRKFHATKASTDVLSFPLNGEVPAERLYIGDVVISYDTAKRQAHDAGWRIADEIDLLAVHGILHLLGYDDLTPRKRAAMWKRQREIIGVIPGEGNK